MTTTNNHHHPPAAAPQLILTKLRHHTHQHLRLDPLRLAEDHGHQLHELLATTNGVLPDGTIETLPHIEVKLDRELPVAGSAYWNGTTWIITLNSTDTPTQRRWTLLHELKHIIDHPHRHTLYGPRHDPVATETAERAADLFAATTLMPTHAVLTQWRNHPHNTTAIAHHFNVTTGAAHYRLHQLGLTPTTPHKPPTTPYLCLHEKGRAA